MPKHRAIDTESDFDYKEHSQEIEIYNTPICDCKKCKFYDNCKRNHKYVCCDCKYIGKIKECKLQDLKLRQLLKNLPMINIERKIISRNKKTNIFTCDEKSPVFKMSKYPRVPYLYRNIVYPHIEDMTVISLNILFDRLNQITVSCGMDLFTTIPNTAETRYEVVYNRLLKPLNKVPDVLINIIILYLLFDDEWKYSFNWDIQLLSNNWY